MSGSTSPVIPIPPINSVCAYTFITKFSSLNGIYTLTEIVMFGDALLAGLDFIVNLYQPAGLTNVDYTRDAPSYQNGAVLVLHPADAGGIIVYAPISILSSMPDPMVACYNKLAIGVALGPFADQSQLTWLINELTSIVGSVLGITAPTIKLYSLGTVHMRVSDYELQLAQRAAAMSQYQTLYQQLQTQIALTTAAQTLNTYYENTLISLAHGGS